MLYKTQYIVDTHLCIYYIFVIIDMSGGIM